MVATGTNTSDRASVVHGRLWDAVDGLLDSATPSGVLRHGLAPLAAQRLRRLGRPVPTEFEREERYTTILAGVAPVLLRAACQAYGGPLMIVKGPEVASLYPARARAFGDIDILATDADAVQTSLLSGGFRHADAEQEGPQHLRPLRWGELPIKLEVHRHPNWPPGLRSPNVDEIFEASVPASLDIEGLRAPSAAHHALILSAHSWTHQPLRIIRDLLDIALVSAFADDGEIEEAASRWGLARVWNTTRGAIDGLFYGGRKTVPLRTWARQLVEVRELTVFESHVRRWVSPCWGMPLPDALLATCLVVRNEVWPAPGEHWRQKGHRVALAVRHAGRRRSEHERMLDASERFRTR